MKINLKNLYIPFSPYDGGGAIGAGMYVNNMYQINLKKQFYTLSRKLMRKF